MDDETARKFADLESAVRNLQSQLAEALNPPPRGSVLSMKQAVYRYGWSRETLRRRASVGEIPGAVKRAGRWQFPA
jgi:hypothetical protein